MHNVMVFLGGDLGRDEISSFIKKKNPRELPHPFLHVRT